MLRGVHKRMIVIKNTGSELFEEVYFILKPQKPSAQRQQGMDIIKAANQLLFEFDKSARDTDGESFPSEVTDTYGERRGADRAGVHSGREGDERIRRGAGQTDEQYYMQNAGGQTDMIGYGEVGSVLYDGAFLNRRKNRAEEAPAAKKKPAPAVSGKLLPKMRTALYFLGGMSLMSAIVLIYYLMDRMMG